VTDDQLTEADLDFAAFLASRRKRRRRGLTIPPKKRENDAYDRQTQQIRTALAAGDRELLASLLKGGVR
jgi:hypothetical protein